MEHTEWLPALSVKIKQDCRYGKIQNKKIFHSIAQSASKKH